MIKTLLALIIATASCFAQVNQAHLKGTTSNVQDQINTKLSTNGGVVAGSFAVTSAPTARITGTNVWLEGRSSVRIFTPSLYAGTAVDGQVLTLTDDANGTVDFTTLSTTDATKLPLAGGTMSGPINMGSQRITNMASPSASTDATTKAYVDAAVSGVSVAAAYPDSAGEIVRLTGAMAGTGRVGLMVYPRNLDGFGVTTNNADFYASTRINRWVQSGSMPPGYIWLREIGTSTWLGYVGTTSTTFGTTNWVPPSVGTYWVMKPMLKSLVGATGWSDEDGGAVGYPITQETPSNTWYQWASGSLSTPATNITRLGIIRGPSYNQSPLCKVAITNSAGVAVVPNMLPTAAQYVASGGLTNILAANGGQFAPTDYVLDVSFRSPQSASAGYMNINTPIADNLFPDSYTMRVTITTNYPQSETSAIRLYVPWITYGNDSLTESTASATLERMGPWSSGADGSSSETYTIHVRPQGSGTYVLIGGYHTTSSPVAGEQELSTTNILDGVGIVPWIRTTQRARSGANVATITTEIPHRMVTGDIVSVSKLSSSVYNVPEVSVTVTGPNTFTYANTGSLESTTADTGGMIIKNKVWTGSDLEVNRSTQFLYAGTNVANGLSTYTFDRFGWRSASTIETVAALDFNTQTYLGLNSAWGGSNLGPMYGGIDRWRIIGTTTSGSLTGTIGSGIEEPNSRGLYAGVVLWSTTSGRATAFFSESPNMQMNNWSDGHFFVQGRGYTNSAAGQDGGVNAGTLGKVYFMRYGTNVSLNVPSGTLYRARNTRLDAQFQNAPSVFR